MHLATFSTNSTSELHVTRHNGNTTSVNGAKVSIFKEANEVSFAGFLESSYSRALETEISLVFLSNFTNETLEGELTDKKFSALLILSDFTKSDGTGTETMRLLDTTGGGSGLTSRLGSKLLVRGLEGNRFARHLLNANHVYKV